MSSLQTLIKTYSIELKQSLRIGLPIMIGQLSYMLIQITDNLMIGHYGVVSLAAASFANSIFSFFLVFAVAALHFTSTTVSKAFGAQRFSECAEAFRVSLSVGGFLGVLMLALLFLFLPFIDQFSQPPEVVLEAGPYLSMLAFSLIPLCLFHGSKQFSESVGMVWIPFYVQLASIAFNAFFNWIFIFGNWGAPELGLFGAGISTLFVRLMSFVFLFAIILRNPQFEKYRPQKWIGAVNQKLLKTSIRLGFPSGLQGLFEVGVFAIAGIMMGWIGAAALAAHQIALSLASATFMVALGLGAAGNIRVSHALGRNDLKSARRIGLGIFGFISVFMLLMALLFYFFRFEIAKAFVADDFEVQALAAKLLILAAVFQVFDGLQVTAISCLRGLEDVKIPTWITFSIYWLIGLPLCYVLGFSLKLGAVGVWIGFAIILFAIALILCLRFWRQTRS
ncbi:MAG: MATE family efflux transporter [Bdellovibrionota bacterium]